MNPRQVEDSVENLLRAANAAGEYMVPLGKITAYLGFKEVRYKGDDVEECPDTEGAVDFKNKIIYININQAAGRMQFVWAKAIGAIWMHHDEKLKVDEIVYYKSMDYT